MSEAEVLTDTNVTPLRGQSQLEGMKDEVDLELRGLAVDFETARDERIAKGQVEKQKKAALELKMNEKGVAHYRDTEAGIEAYFEVEKNLKVKRIKVEKKDETAE